LFVQSLGLLRGLLRGLWYYSIKSDQGGKTVKGKLDKLILMAMTLVLLLVLAVGYVTPEITNRVVEPKPVTMEAWDGMHGLLAPVMGGGSSAG
jgi:hypothetical protein